MRRILSLIYLALVIPCLAQESDKQEVLKVVSQVFEAMRSNDSTLLKDAFVKNPATYTIFKNPDGVTQFRIGDFQQFKNAVGTEKKDVWNEPIWNEVITIDGALAQVWVDYAFYLNDKFLHCGVDAFHLVHKDGKWKIFHLVDTRRKEGCEIPVEIQKKFGKL